MAEVNGRLLICDRCGKSVFIKYVGEGEADGGFTRWNKFEDPPDGWAYHTPTVRLCPECNNLYLSIMADFMKKETV